MKVNIGLNPQLSFLRQIYVGVKSKLSEYIPQPVSRFPLSLSHREIRLMLSGTILALVGSLVVLVFRQFLASLFLVQNLESWAKMQSPNASSNEKNKVLNAIKFCYVKRSSHLCLKGCKLTSLPSCIAEFSWITDFDLSDNAFENIPSEIKPDRLRKLNLLNNPLTQIPDPISKLSSLEFLYNPIETDT